jgi:hypothetical protein
MAIERKYEGDLLSRMGEAAKDHFKNKSNDMLNDLFPMFKDSWFGKDAKKDKNNQTEYDIKKEKSELSGDLSEEIIDELQSIHQAIRNSNEILVDIGNKIGLLRGSEENGSGSGTGNGNENGSGGWVSNLLSGLTGGAIGNGLKGIGSAALAGMEIGGATALAGGTAALATGAISAEVYSGVTKKIENQKENEKIELSKEDNHKSQYEQIYGKDLVDSLQTKYIKDNTSMFPHVGGTRSDPLTGNMNRHYAELKAEQEAIIKKESVNLEKYKERKKDSLGWVFDKTNQSEIDSSTKKIDDAQEQMKLIGMDQSEKSESLSKLQNPEISLPIKSDTKSPYGLLSVPNIESNGLPKIKEFHAESHTNGIEVPVEINKENFIPVLEAAHLNNTAKELKEDKITLSEAYKVLLNKINKEMDSSDSISSDNSKEKELLDKSKTEEKSINDLKKETESDVSDNESLNSDNSLKSKLEEFPINQNAQTLQNSNSGNNGNAASVANVAPSLDSSSSNGPSLQSGFNPEILNPLSPLYNPAATRFRHPTKGNSPYTHRDSTEGNTSDSRPTEPEYKPQLTQAEKDAYEAIGDTPITTKNPKVAIFDRYSREELKRVGIEKFTDEKDGQEKIKKLPISEDQIKENIAHDKHNKGKQSGLTQDQQLKFAAFVSASMEGGGGHQNKLNTALSMLNRGKQNYGNYGDLYNQLVAKEQYSPISASLRGSSADPNALRIAGANVTEDQIKEAIKSNDPYSAMAKLYNKPQSSIDAAKRVEQSIKTNDDSFKTAQETIGGRTDYRAGGQNGGNAFREENAKKSPASWSDFTEKMTDGKYSPEERQKAIALIKSQQEEGLAALMHPKSEPTSNIIPKTVAVGDSIAVGYNTNAKIGTLQGPGGTQESLVDDQLYAKVGASPSTIKSNVEAILKKNPDAFKGKSVNFSTGLENDSTQTKDAIEAYHMIEKSGASKIIVSGVSNADKFKPSQKALEEFGKETKADIQPNFTPGSDGMHPDKPSEYYSGIKDKFTQIANKNNSSGPTTKDLTISKAAFNLSDTKSLAKDYDSMIEGARQISNGSNDLHKDVGSGQISYDTGSLHACIRGTTGVIASLTGDRQMGKVANNAGAYSNIDYLQKTGKYEPSSDMPDGYKNDPNQWRIGDTVSAEGGSRGGHIQTWNGKEWISDFKQSGILGGYGNYKLHRMNTPGLSSLNPDYVKNYDNNGQTSKAINEQVVPAQNKLNQSLEISKNINNMKGRSISTVPKGQSEQDNDNKQLKQAQNINKTLGPSTANAKLKVSGMADKGYQFNEKTGQLENPMTQFDSSNTPTNYSPKPKANPPLSSEPQKNASDLFSKPQKDTSSVDDLSHVSDFIANGDYKKAQTQSPILTQALTDATHNDIISNQLSTEKSGHSPPIIQNNNSHIAHNGTRSENHKDKIERKPIAPPDARIKELFMSKTGKASEPI